jgi:hypothetical protein
MEKTIDKITDLKSAMEAVSSILPAKKTQDPVFMDTLEDHVLGRIVQIMVGMMSVRDGESLVSAMDENPESIPELIKNIIDNNPDIEREISTEVDHLKKILSR